MSEINLTRFEEEVIPDEVTKFNAQLIAQGKAGPGLWEMEPHMMRAARREGRTLMPLEAFDPNVETLKIAGKGGDIGLRIIRPSQRRERGSFLHFHGGGWVLGNADLQDQRLKELANATGMACISVEYRLAPENPYPAAPDDCELAALWLIREGGNHLNTDFLSIGGESAGGHLAANCLLRLRDRHALKPFHAAIFVAGAFDLGMTPSAVYFNENLILSHKDMVNFTACFLQNGEDRRHPDISPLYASLPGMPPAHFSVGTRDPLLDDSVFMANRWKQVQPVTELDIYPGGCHVFQYFEHLEQSRQSRAAMARFLNHQIEERLCVPVDLQNT